MTRRKIKENIPMGDYLRVFCTKEEYPTINEILKWTKLKGYYLRVDKNYNDVNIDSRNWDEVAIIGEDGQRAFIAEINRDNNDKDSLMKSEVNEFLQILKEVEDCPAEELAKVIKHLNKTKYIVAIQVASDYVEEEGDTSVSVFLKYFVDNCGGMVQEDGEGFFEGDKLIVEII